MSASKLRKNDLLAAIVGATIGKIGVYQYDKEGNIISEMYLYTNNLTVGTTVTDSYYLKNDTVRKD